MISNPMMKTIGFRTFILLCACPFLVHGAQQVVVPNGLDNVEGNSSSADLFRTESTTFQQVFSASAFNFLGAPTGRIDGISFRFDGGSGQSFVGFWPGYSVILSTTTQSPDSLSPNFGENAGPDAVVVAGGLLGILAVDSPGVRAFEVRIPFTTPFFYDPSRGNLSMYIGTAPGSTSLMLDAQFVAGDSVGRVFGDGTSGTVDSLGLVTRFDFTPVPEPSSWLIAGIGALLVFWHLFRQGQIPLIVRRR